MNDVVLSAQGVCKRYEDAGSEPPVLNGLQFELRTGDSVAIVGASGAGKSTLLHVLGGLDKPSSGSVLWNGQAIEQWSEKTLGAHRNSHLGFVYQFHHLLPEFSALDNIAVPLRIRGLARDAARATASQWLDKVGLSHRAEHLPSQLSGGERQRVAIARALVTQPKALLADEPTGNLDRQTAEKVFQEMLALNASAGVALLLVTHSDALARRCKRVMRLENGQLQDITGELT